MQIKDFLELVRSRRSIRRFTDVVVNDDQVKQILEAARWAMSGANGQPWEFITVRNKETKYKIADAFMHYYKDQMTVESTRMPEYRHASVAQKERGELFWKDAPILIAVLGDMRTMQASTIAHRFYEQHTFDQNMANTVQMIHLAAAASGLGSQWISLDPPRSESIKLILGIPPEIRLFCLVAIGYPAYQKAGKRRDLSELIHYEKYDMSRLRSQADIQEFIKNLRKSI